MRICVIGNSYSVCVSLAWRELKESHPDVSMVFYQKGGRFFQQFVPDFESKLLTMPNRWTRTLFEQSSGGDGDIDFQNFDICLIVGGVSRQHVRMLSQLGGQSKTGFTTQAIDASIFDLFEATHIYALLPKIREVSEIPVFLFHDPIIAHSKGLSTSEMSNPFESFDYETGVRIANETMFSLASMEMLLQPIDTLAASHLTKYEFAIGFRKPYPSEIEAGYKGELKDDRGHMKPTFGALQILALFARLEILSVTL